MGKFTYMGIDTAQQIVDLNDKFNDLIDALAEFTGLTVGTTYAGRQLAVVNASGEATDSRPAGDIALSELVTAAALSVLCRAGGTGGDRADLAASADGQVLLRRAGALLFAALAAGELPSGIDAAKISGGNVSNAEFDYLDGVTSAIQTQLNAKLTGSFLPGSSRARLHSPTTTEITGYAEANINWGGEYEDTDNYHEGVTNPHYITIPATGGYALTCNVIASKSGGTVEGDAALTLGGGTPVISGKAFVYSSVLQVALGLTHVGYWTAATNLWFTFKNFNAGALAVGSGYAEIVRLW